MKSRKHIFISYVREDKQVVEGIARALREKGEKVWYDEQLLPGDKWRHKIYEAIDNSYAFVFFVSSNLENRIRAGVFPEVERALEIQRQLGPEAKYFFPVRHDDLDLPRLEVRPGQYIKDVFQTCDLFGTKKTINRNFAALLASISRCPLRPSLATKQGTPDCKVPPTLASVLEDICEWILRRNNIVKFGIVFALLFFFLLGVAPVLQWSIDQVGAENTSGLGWPLAFCTWFLCSALVFFEPWKKQNPFLKRRNNQESFPFLQAVLLGAFLSSIWLFGSSFFVQQIATELAEKFAPNSSSSILVGCSGTIIGLLGQLVIIRIFVSHFYKGLIRSVYLKYGLAFLIGLVPGIFWALLITPEVAATLGSTDSSPFLFEKFGISHLFYLGIERLILTPAMCVISMLGLRL